MKTLTLAVLIAIAARCHGTDTPPGWQLNKTVSECNRYMLDHQLSTDVSFQVGPQDGARSLIRAHKYVLTSRSAVFETMLYRHQKQLKGQNRTAGDSDIRISDMDPGVFKEMLNFIYTDNATVTLKNVLPLMYAGKKYQLPKLIGECQQILQANISTDNVCIILDQAILFEEQELVNKSVRFIGMHADKVVKSDAFFNLSKEALRVVVSSDWLVIEETAVYNACVEWAKIQLKNSPEKIENATDSMIRSTLGEVFYNIRFPTMNLTEFATLSGRSEVLRCDEKASIYYYIGTKNDTSNSLKFNRTKRYVERSIFRYGDSVEQNWRCNSQPDAIQFTSDRDIILTGIGTYGPSNQERDVLNATTTTVDILLSRGTIPEYEYEYMSIGHIRIGGAASFTANYSNFTYGNQILKIRLDESVEIKANTLYIVKLLTQFGGRNGCYQAYGQNGQTIVTSEPSITFRFSDASIPEGTQTTTYSGQIPALYYINA